MLKVADFGTSRFLEIAAHGTTVIGSPPYMAPEQFHGKAVFASDIYSLGVTMYQMLTGMLPVRHAGAGGPRQADVRRAGESPPRLRTRRSRRPSATSSCGRWRPTSPPATSGRPTCSTTCSAPARRRRRGARRQPASIAAVEPPLAHAARGSGQPSEPAASARHARPPGSAGNAASRCTPAPTAARSATKRNRGTPGVFVSAELERGYRLKASG